METHLTGIEARAVAKPFMISRTDLKTGRHTFQTTRFALVYADENDQVMSLQKADLALGQLVHVVGKTADGLVIKKFEPHQ
ncbi:hypothetical protein IV38_GL000562 [Lactobacillus selangorensis]|uniref:Uncharacterized protein n=1 Tax=Lactobacillus selangorensis TaxID=81857 RepID=A0A0R2GAI6_9LACO|nr:hypothetical protein [Lactobacillus selangorensis]KRN29675.1 hypothetical protein IV38_GL000562 [Lactobacillus selangorensis]KRN33796.1 hypothetical protein IV40_GL000106 [Lactobacillus selangorensis]